MSESVATAEAPIAAPEEPFDRSDVSHFRSDDAEAGKNICKMLVAFFFYSLLAMAFVTWWAFSAMNANHADSPAPAAQGTHH